MTCAQPSSLRRADLPNDAVLVREFTTFTELTEEMMRAEVVIASRFHNLICALRLARPTVSVGYAKKNHHLMAALGLETYCQDMEHLDASWLVARSEPLGRRQTPLPLGSAAARPSMRMRLSPCSSELRMTRWVSRHDRGAG